MGRGCSRPGRLSRGGAADRASAAGCVLGRGRTDEPPLPRRGRPRVSPPHPPKPSPPHAHHPPPPPHPHPPASCDNITIAPALLKELEASTDPLPRRLSPGGPASADALVSGFDSNAFESLHGADRMAVEKLAQGIEGFAADQVGPCGVLGVSGVGAGGSGGDVGGALALQSPRRAHPAPCALAAPILLPPGQAGGAAGGAG
jgi:hypothetical protein